MPEKRNGVWRTDIRINGQRIRRSLGPKATKRDALALEAKLRDEALNQKLGRKPDYTFDEALLRWLKEDAPQLKSYENLKNKARLVRPYMAGVLLRDAHKAAESMKQALIKERLRPATINRRLALVRRILSIAYKRWEWLSEPLSAKIELLQENNQRHIYLTKTQVLALSAECYDPKAGDAILLAACTGLRASELSGLRAENLVDGCIVLDANTKTARPRVIPLPKMVKHITLPLGVTEHQIRGNWERARKALGLSHVHFHDLRHTYASWVAKSSGDMAAVRDLLGHTSVQTTSRYTHLMADHLKDVVDKTFGED